MVKRLVHSLKWSDRLVHILVWEYLHTFIHILVHTQGFYSATLDQNYVIQRKHIINQRYTNTVKAKTIEEINEFLNNLLTWMKLNLLCELNLANCSISPGMQVRNFHQRRIEVPFCGILEQRDMYCLEVVE